MGTDDGRPAVLGVAYDEAVEIAERLSTSIAAVRGRACSADGSVTATVGPHGVLLDLDIRLPVDDAPAGPELAHRVLEAVARAGLLAQQRRLAAIDACLPTSLRGLVGAGGEVDPTALLPADGRGTGRQ